MIRTKLFCVSFAAIMLFSAATIGYANSINVHSPCFSMDLTGNLKLISKTEEKNNGFYRYVFASSNNDNAELQMRIIVSNKKPAAGQSLEDFQVSSIGAMSVMFMESYKLYQYLNTPENQKFLRSKPYKLKVGNSSFAQATMYFGTIDASFLLTRSHDMTYAFTLVSKNNNKQIRKNNLKKLIGQLQSIKFQSCSG